MAPSLGSFRGTITSAGYTPPFNTRVTWTHPSAPVPKTKSLNPNIHISNHFDLLSRYGENDQSLAGWQTLPPVSAETSGGEIYPLVEELFKRHGLLRVPTAAEWVDFAFANFGGIIFVTLPMARNVLPDYRQDENVDTGGGSTDNSTELVTLRTKILILEREISTLKSKVRLLIPSEIDKTLTEMLLWRLIPARGARLLRLHTLVKWIRDERKKRGL